MLRSGSVAAVGLRRPIACLLVLTGLGPATHAAAQPTAPPTAPELWERLRPALPPLSYEVLSDRVVPSDTRRGAMLRRVELRFVSQHVGRLARPMHHTAVLYVPAGSASPIPGARSGKVVVVGQRYGDDSILHNYGEPIAAATGYPTMVLPVPGEYDGCDGESCWIYFLASEMARSGDALDHNYVRLAVPYLRALDVLEDLLGLDRAQAVIGGHSKRATAAYTAAAMDPDRITGVVYMGNESVWEGLPPDHPAAIVAPTRTQATVRARVLYIGATNEGGYRMFSINRIAGQMRSPWTVEYIPNHRHATDSEVQALAWQMWVAHVHDGRPLSRIVDFSHAEVPEGTVFWARVESPNTIVHVKAWYAYTDDPYWRDLMWYPVDLEKNGEHYEGFHEGVLPDAWLVEVKDVARGTVGYVSTLPQDLTARPTRRRSGGGLPRLWRLKAGAVGAPPLKDEGTSPQSRWQQLRATLPPTTFERLAAGAAADPTRGLRRVDVRFRSQTIGRFRRQMDHDGTIFVPSPSTAARADVLVIGVPYRDLESARRMAARLASESGRATMVLPVPGEYDGHDGENCWGYFLRAEVRETGNPVDHPDFRLAVAYLRALDVLADVLGTPAIRAVVGGDGQRAAAALAAAALDPARIAGVIYGSYDRPGSDPLDRATIADPASPLASGDPITAPVLELQPPGSSRGHRDAIGRWRRSTAGRWVVAGLPESPTRRERALITHWRAWARQVFDGRRDAAKGAVR